MFLYLAIFSIALIASLCFMPFALIISNRLRAYSEIGGRHVGIKPIGRLGGLGIVFGIILSSFISFHFDFLFDDRFGVASFQLIGVVLGGVVVGAFGFFDDVRRLPAVYKLAGQVLGSIIAYGFNLKISGIGLPFFEPIKLGMLSFPATIIWIVVIVNSINLIDGLDGLAGGVVIFAAVANFVAATNSGYTMPAILMAGVIGSVLGFLFFNWHPAKIYLGDGGAYSLGFILAVSALLGPHQKASTGIGLLIPILASGLPIFDTLLTVFRRAINHRSVFSPDRGHLHHVLLDSGISHRRVVIGLYSVSLIFCSTALLLVLNRRRGLGFSLIAFSLIGCLIWCIPVRKKLLATSIKIFKNRLQ